MPLCRVTVQNASRDSMGPLGMTKCQITMGGKNYAGEFVVCKYLKCPCIIGTDLLKKNAIYVDGINGGSLISNMMMTS